MFGETLPYILEWGRGTKSSPVFHSHPFFQIEIGLKGRLIGRCRKEEIVLTPGDCWVIPPDTQHAFVTEAEKPLYISIKFLFPNFAPLRRNNSVSRYYTGEIARLLQDFSSETLLPGSTRTILEGALYQLLRALSPENQSPDEDVPELFHRIANHIIRSGFQGANIDFLAQSMQLSRAQLKYRFAKENRLNVSLKGLLDAILLYIAKEQLHYSRRTILEISERMKFPDIYAFSRFFKRCSGGMSPRRFRQMTGVLLPPINAKSPIAEIYAQLSGQNINESDLCLPIGSK